MALYKIQPQPIQGSLDLQRQLQSIEQQLKFNRNSPVDREQIIDALENTHQSLQALQRRTATIGVFAKCALTKNVDEFLQARSLSELEELNQLKEKIISLYGDIYTLSIDEEIAGIRSEAEDLGRSLSQGDLNEICRNINILSKHIDTFCRNHRPSRHDRHTIAFARETLKKADQILFDKVLGPTLNQFNLLALRRTATLNIYDIEDLEPDIVALFEIAELYYQQHFKNAQTQFNRLAQSVRKKVFAHLEKTNKTLNEGQQEVYPMIQALIATAHEISDSDDGEGYLSKKDIDSLFQEIDAVKKEDASPIMKKLPQTTTNSWFHSAAERALPTASEMVASFEN
jgi:hypothetical protein